MLNPENVKIGDRLKWHLRPGGYWDYVVRDGHGAMVIKEPYKTNDLAGNSVWRICVKWDSGTNQNAGAYDLKDFDRWNEAEMTTSGPAPDVELCNCKNPILVESSVMGKKFLFCRVCKKERL
jgi:hypothetical protein